MRYGMRWALLIAICGLCVLSGFTCGPTLKNCRLDEDCSRNARCQEYRCQTLDSCQSDGDCLSPRRCIDNLCQNPPSGCQSDKDCSGKRVCQNAKCVEPPPSGCQSDKDCTAPRICKEKKCVTPPPVGCQSDNDCTAPRVCQNAKCVEPPPSGCKVDGDCQPNEVCQANKCVASPKGCQSDGDCKPGERCDTRVCVLDKSLCTKDADCAANEMCQAGKCSPKSVAKCKLESDPASISVTISSGRQEVINLRLVNKGDAPCWIEQMSLTLTDAPAGSWNVDVVKPFELVVSGSLRLSVTYTSKAATGTVTSALEIFSKNALLLHKVSLSGTNKPGHTTSPMKGWTVVRNDKNAQASGSYIGGCFWKDGSIEVVSESPFTDIDGFSFERGSMIKSVDNGKTWTCTNCSRFQGSPPAPSTDLVDLKANSMVCQGGRGFVSGFYPHLQPGQGMEPTPIFTRSDANAQWKRASVNSNHPSKLGLEKESIFAGAGRWFMIIGGLFAESKLDGNGGLVSQYSIFYESTDHRVSVFHKAHNIGLVIGKEQYQVGRQFRERPFIFYNTHNTTIPASTPRAGLSKFWTSVTNLPCSNCQVSRGYVLGAKSFLVASHEFKGPKTDWILWRTDDLGKSWTQVFKESGYYLTGADILRVDANRIVVVAGSGSLLGQSGTNGLLLESADNARSFQPVPTSGITGDVPTKGLPPMNKLIASQDGKTLIAAGAGLLLRWTP